MVLAPEHPLVDKITTEEYKEQVKAYQYAASRQSEIERLAIDKEKTGVFTGSYAINPVNGEKIPVWMADYVMMVTELGRLWPFPPMTNGILPLPVSITYRSRIVIAPAEALAEPLTEAYTEVEKGKMVNSGPFTGVPAAEGKMKVTSWLAEQGIGP